MKYHYLTAFAAGIVVSAVAAVNAGSQDTTIQTCASLLPEGHVFELAIDGAIDTTSAAREFRGQFELTNGTEQDDPALEAAIQPFVTCVSSFLK